MSTADYSSAPAFCEVGDVQEALQESDAQMGQKPLGDANVEPAIYAASRWFASASNGYWYDSGAADADLISTTAASESDRLLDVPDSPHRQDGQMFRSDRTGRTRATYPVTQAGRYVRVKLPKRYVESITRLAVRQPGGEVVDFVNDPNYDEGRGEDYYFRTEGSNTGRSHLYVDAGALGPHKDFSDLLEVNITHGKDWQDDTWVAVRRGIAALAAAHLVSDDDILSSLPDNGSLIGVDTQVQQLLNQALGIAEGVGGYLSPYLGQPIE